jgi:hypothetical protein
MANSSSNAPLGVVRSAAVISLGLVSLAGSIAAALCRRILTPAATTEPAAAQVSKLVLDEWEADLARLNLPSRREVEELQHRLAELEAQIDQLTQQPPQPPEGA